MPLSDNEMRTQLKRHMEVDRQLQEWNQDLRVRGALIRDVFCPWRDGGVRLYDDVEPLYKSDTYEDALKKYMRLYPDEAAQFMIQMNNFKGALDDEKGHTKSRNNRLVCKLPEVLANMTRNYFPQYLETKKGLHDLQRIIPKCFVGQI
jgi:hypothetical protein